MASAGYASSCSSVYSFTRRRALSERLLFSMVSTVTSVRARGGGDVAGGEVVTDGRLGLLVRLEPDGRPAMQLAAGGRVRGVRGDCVAGRRTGGGSGSARRGRRGRSRRGSRGRGERGRRRRRRGRSRPRTAAPSTRRGSTCPGGTAGAREAGVRAPRRAGSRRWRAGRRAPRAATRRAPGPHRQRCQVEARRPTFGGLEQRGHRVTGLDLPVRALRLLATVPDPVKSEQRQRFVAVERELVEANLQELSSCPQAAERQRRVAP